MAGAKHLRDVAAGKRGFDFGPLVVLTDVLLKQEALSPDDAAAMMGKATL